MPFWSRVMQIDAAADADLDEVGAGLGQVAEAAAVDDVAGADGDVVAVGSSRTNSRVCACQTE